MATEKRILNCLVLLLLASQLCGASFHYEAPSDCQWTLMNSSMSLPASGASAGGTAGVGSMGHSALPMTSGANDVALHCRLRTINSQFDQTNFSVVPREHTAALTIECSDSLLYQRYVAFLYNNINPVVALLLTEIGSRFLAEEAPPRNPIPNWKVSQQLMNNLNCKWTSSLSLRSYLAGGESLLPDTLCIRLEMLCQKFSPAVAPKYIDTYVSISGLFLLFFCFSPTFPQLFTKLTPCFHSFLIQFPAPAQLRPSASPSPVGNFVLQTGTDGPWRLSRTSGPSLVDDSITQRRLAGHEPGFESR